MKEMDFYIELLDDFGADFILREYGEKVPGFMKTSPPLAMKKKYIKKMFLR